MRTRFHVAPAMLATAALAAALGACDNMGDQRSVRPLEPAPARPEETSARAVPAGTVPRGARGPEDPVATGRRGAEALERNPLPVTRELLARGRERFWIYCAPCHGADGYGSGIVARRGFPAPPSYHKERLRAAPDGRLFDVITRGYGAMLPYGDRLSPEDRWAVVAYLRALQRSQHGALADVPAEARASLLSP